MSTKMIIFLFAIVLIVVLVAGSLRRGPRVTQIDRTVRREKDSDDA
jgi:hypothetical protein